jgi:hypothetical protein
LRLLLVLLVLLDAVDGVAAGNLAGICSGLHSEGRVRGVGQAA